MTDDPQPAWPAIGAALEEYAKKFPSREEAAKALGAAHLDALRRSAEQYHKAHRYEELEFNERELKALVRVAENGWFPSLLPIALDVANVAQQFEDDPQAASEWCMAEYTYQLDTIEDMLITSYPSRKAILADAFEAHRNGKYTLSVPVFLAQADGIFAEESRGGPSVFMERERKTAAADHSDRAPVTVVKRWLAVFGNVLPLWMSRKDRSSASFEGLNRHLVLHGESVDYHTEENSLKAISLLRYFDMLFSEIRAVEKEDHRKQRELSRGEGLDLGEGK